MSKVDFVKCTLFPHKNSVQEARDKMILQPDARPSHIGDCLDGENAQTNEDEEQIGVKSHSNLKILNPDQYDFGKGAFPTTSDKSKYSKIDISNTVEMLSSARKLVPEQRLVFDTIIQYCKEFRQCQSEKSLAPKAPLLMIHGGAGSGKTKMIHDISSWAEYFLRTDDNRSPDQPSIIKVAPTGKAASLIGGLTLHSAFNFKFNNEFTSLSDKEKERTRINLSFLRIVIVDEISMVKSDLLYQLDLRLKELTQCDNPFGGLSVLLFGDLMQLQPVRARWIFENPSSKMYEIGHAMQSLWLLFDCFELNQNHRQGNDKSYADLLNRIRFGIYTENDIELLNSRISNEDFDEALHIYGKNSLVNAHNNKLLNHLRQELFTFHAIHIHPSKENYKPLRNKEGRVGETPFMEKFSVKVGAKVMIIYNIDTSECLTNGSTGTVTGFISNKNNSVEFIMVQLDDIEAGYSLKSKHVDLTEKFPGSVAISRITFEYSIGSRNTDNTYKVQVIQFPLTLAWAITAHKVQGQTVKQPQKVVADINSVFAAGQAYVILGRVQSIDQLILKSFNTKKIIVSQKALIESSRISNIAKTKVLTTADLPDQISITCLNIRSLNKHYLDLISDKQISRADIICLTETHLLSNNQNEYSLDEYRSIQLNFGKGKGVCVYVKNSITIYASKKILSKYFQICWIKLESLEIIVVYRSPSNDRKIKKLIKRLIDLVSMSSNDMIICGDFNIQWNLEKPHLLSQTLLNLGFQQLINKPTHLQGNILDHFYTKLSHSKIAKTYVHYPYYTDHDAICATLVKFQQ